MAGVVSRLHRILLSFFSKAFPKMKNVEPAKSGRLFRVAARGRASTIFRPGSSLAINYELDGKKSRLVFQTRYIEKGYSTPVAGDLWMDAQGESEDLESAAAAYSNAGRDMCAIISLVMNASISPLEPEVVFEVTPGVTRRPLLQRFMPADQMALSSRFVDIDAVLKVIALMAKHPERDRLTRAISQYSEALNTWRHGAEVPTLSHLFMGVEALKTAMWRQSLRVGGQSKEDLGKEWGFDPSRRLTLDQFLNEIARSKLVYKDDPILKKAKSVSDSFEHGFANAGLLYQPARESLMKTAKYLRSAILELAGLPDADREALLKKYPKPRGPGGLEMYWRTTLVGEAEHLGPPGGEYPMYHWQVMYEDVTFNSETDLYEFRPSHTFTAQMAEGLVFEGGSLEIWDAGTFTPHNEDDKSQG